MNTPAWGLMIAALIFWASDGWAFGEDGPPTNASVPVDATAPGRVSSLGRKEALTFEGNKSFSREQILYALGWQLDFLLAAHPAAPLADYPRAVERMVRLGYLRQGFSEARVKASADVANGRVIVRIEEGPRYKVGKVRFIGAKPIMDPSLQARLRQVLELGPNPGSGSASTNAQNGLWTKDGYAPFDEFAAEQMQALLMAELANANFYQPKLKLSVAPLPTFKEADLVIELVDEGLKGTVDDIGIFYPNDDKKNTDPELQHFLGLEPGMALRADMVQDITNRLWSSGRFLKHEATLAPLPEPGHFKLELDLEDLEAAPPLSQDLSTNEMVWLKLCSWLNQFEQHPEDLVFSCLAELPDHMQVRGELILSNSGMAFRVRNLGTNGAEGLGYGVAMSSKVASYYAGWRRRKLVTPEPGTVTAFITVTPNSPARQGHRFNLTLGAGVSSKDSERPIDLEFKLAPAKFLELSREDGVQHRLEGGVLHSTFSGQEPFDSVTVSIEAATGRLTECRVSAKTNDLSLALELRSQQGAYNRLASELAAESTGFVDEYVAGYGKSSWLGFLLTDLLESGVLESSVVSNGLASSYTAKIAADFARQAGEVRAFVGQFQRALGKTNLIECLLPLEAKLKPLLSFGPATKVSENDDFFIPERLAAGQSSLGFVMGKIGAYMADRSDSVWPRDSWPWTLTRETGFTLAGRNPYTGHELDRLFSSDQTGPLGCWAAAALLAHLNTVMAEKFARRGLERVSPERLEQDLAVLLAPDTAAGQVLAEAMAMLGRIKESDLEGLARMLGPGAAPFIFDVGQAFRGSTNQTPAIALRPVIERSWGPTIQPGLNGGIGALLSQVSTPANPDSAFARGNFIMASATKPEEFEEAAKAFTFAAERGHSPSQLRLGWFYLNGQGVRQDLPAALKWLTLAAESNEPHAACRLGDMYFSGQGVEQDREAARKWYEREAQHGCHHAQFQLGHCAELQSNQDQAMLWYRRAATNGSAQAQVALGERLSDEMGPKPDYLEAFLWYRVAAEAGDRVAVVSARRIKAKLSHTQLEQVEKEARKLRKRIEEKAAE